MNVHAQSQKEAVLFCNHLLEAVQEMRKTKQTSFNGVSQFTGNTYKNQKKGDDSKTKDLDGYPKFNLFSSSNRPGIGSKGHFVNFNGADHQYNLVNNTGAGLNCFFFSALDQLDKQMTNENAEKLRDMVIEYAEKMVKTPGQYKGFTIAGDNKMYIETSQEGWVVADEIKNQLNTPDFKANTQGRRIQTDTIFGSVLASLLKRPVLIVGKLNGGLPLAQMFDIDLQTGDKLTGNPIRIHYDGTHGGSSTFFGHFQSIHDWK